MSDEEANLYFRKKNKTFRKTIFEKNNWRRRKDHLYGAQTSKEVQMSSSNTMVLPAAGLPKKSKQDAVLYYHDRKRFIEGLVVPMNDNPASVEVEKGA